MTVLTRPAISRPYRAAASLPAADLAGALLRLMLFIGLPMGAIIYSGAWFWPQNGFDYFTASGVGQKEFRIAFWCVVVVVVGSAGLRCSPRLALNAFAPYGAFFVIAVLSTLFSDDRLGSAWFLAQWFIMGSMGISIGLLSSPRRLEASATLLFIAVPFISVALLAVHPSWVTMPFQGKTLLRGLFLHKNATGAFTAGGALFLISFQAKVRRPWMRWAGIGLCLLVLALSLSLTAIGEFGIGLAAFFIIGRIHAIKAPVAAKVGLMFSGLALMMLIVSVVLPVVISAMNKSLSLDNRVAGWGLYWHFFQDHLLLGRGPGAFVTGTSNINKMIETLIPNDKNGSVHNAYLAILGEIGLPGLILYVLGLIYIIVVAPLRRHANTADIAAAVTAASILAGSFTEARETLTPGLSTFLVMICRGAAIASRDAQQRARSSVSGPAGRRSPNSIAAEAGGLDAPSRVPQ